MNRFLKALICLVCIAVFCYSSWQIYEILQSRYSANSHYNSYDEFVEEDTTDESTTNKAHKPKKTSSFTVDFEKLTAIYEDVTGWLHFNDVAISYPVMQGEDNTYYLTRLPNGTQNSSGSIFVDYRNNTIRKDDNYIIYGHNMKNDTMFGLLDEYSNQAFYELHPFFYYLTPDKFYKVDIIAGCVVNSDSAIYKINFSDKELTELVSELVKSSTFSADIKYKKGDKLVTLSTCSGNSQETRYVLVGVVSE